MRRRVIGRLKRSKQGGWEGEINTLTIQRKLRLVPNDNRTGTDAPAFRVMLGKEATGEAWEKKSRSDPPRDYLRVKIDDPYGPLSAALFFNEENDDARLVWSPPYETSGGPNSRRDDRRVGRQ